MSHPKFKLPKTLSVEGLTDKVTSGAIVNRMQFEAAALLAFVEKEGLAGTENKNRGLAAIASRHWMTLAKLNHRIAKKSMKRVSASIDFDDESIALPDTEIVKILRKKAKAKV